MIDREKLICALECCIELINDRYGNECDDCPYADKDEGTCVDFTPLLKDAVTQLEADGRLLTRISRIVSEAGEEISTMKDILNRIREDAS